MILSLIHISLRQWRDAVQEDRLALAERTRDLAERQDLEVSCAVLAERARIAREIHDNVGHLLTRSVLQMEALAVTHEDDPALAKELAAVGATLHEALGTVRASVHDLHDEAFDPQTTLAELIGEFPGVAGTVSYTHLRIALPRLRERGDSMEERKGCRAQTRTPESQKGVSATMDRRTFATLAGAARCV